LRKRSPKYQVGELIIPTLGDGWLRSKWSPAIVLECRELNKTAYGSTSEKRAEYLLYVNGRKEWWKDLAVRASFNKIS